MFALHFGHIDRGADVSWLSYFPAEKEVAAHSPPFCSPSAVQLPTSCIADSIPPLFVERSSQGDGGSGGWQVLLPPLSGLEGQGSSAFLRTEKGLVKVYQAPSCTITSSHLPRLWLAKPSASCARQRYDKSLCHVTVVLLGPPWRFASPEQI